MSSRPIEGLCPVCDKTFAYSIRAQGGGRHQIYCSKVCAQKDWARGNPERRQAIVTKYDHRPENKEAKRARARKATLTKYGWTEEQFTTRLLLQESKCAGCGGSIDCTTARIDHNHGNGTTRGLLCDSCNWALGHTKDSPDVLRRLANYVERDGASKDLIYLVGSLRNPVVPEIANELAQAGYEVFADWAAAGKIADDSWKDYEQLRGRTYKTALASPAAQHVFEFDKRWLTAASIVVLVAPAGKSGHLELGWSLGHGKKGYVLLDGEPTDDRWDVMYNFADGVFYNVKELISALNGQEVINEQDKPAQVRPASGFLRAGGGGDRGWVVRDWLLPTSHWNDIVTGAVN